MREEPPLSLCPVGNLILQPCLNSLRQCAEIANPLQFVVGQLHMEVLLQACKQTQSLKAIDPKLLEKIVIRREALARDLELRRGKVKDFVGGLLLASHIPYYGKYGWASVVSTNFLRAA